MRYQIRPFRPDPRSDRALPRPRPGGLVPYLVPYPARSHHPRPLQPRPAHPAGAGHGPPRQRAGPPLRAPRRRGRGWWLRAG